MAARRRIRTLAHLAESLGISVRTAQRWRAEGMPQPKRGSWDIEQIRAWNRDRASARRDARRSRPIEESEIRAITRTDQLPPEDDDAPGVPAAPRSTGSWDLDVDQQLAAGIRPRVIVAEQEARRRYWLAERERIAARKESGELIAATVAQDRIVRLCSAFRRLFLDHCRRAAPLVVAVEETLAVQRVLEREAEAALASIQQMGGVPA